MARNDYVTVRGWDEINATLGLLSAKEGKGAIRRAIRRAMKPMLLDAIDKAPAASGAMKAAIKIRARTKAGRIGFTLGTSAKDYSGDHFYASFQEYGWKAGPRKKGGDRRQVEGKHFLEATFDRLGDACRSDAERYMVKNIEKVAARKSASFGDDS